MSEQLAPAKWVEPIKLKAQAHVYELGSGLAQLFFIGLTNNLKNSFFFFIYISGLSLVHPILHGHWRSLVTMFCCKPITEHELSMFCIQVLSFKKLIGEE
jgi:hypothetical protein